MLKVKFANTAEIEYLTALETEEYWNGSARRTLKIECSVDAIDVDSLNKILSNETNIATITLTNTEEQISNIYDGYVLKMKVGIEPALIAPEAASAEAVYEDRLVFKMGKRTYTEEHIAKNAEYMAALEEVGVEV